MAKKAKNSDKPTTPPPLIDYRVTLGGDEPAILLYLGGQFQETAMTSSFR
jgi:hypothetical protein